MFKENQDRGNIRKRVGNGEEKEPMKKMQRIGTMEAARIETEKRKRESDSKVLDAIEKSMSLPALWEMRKDAFVGYRAFGLECSSKNCQFLIQQYLGDGRPRAIGSGTMASVYLSPRAVFPDQPKPNVRPAAAVKVFKGLNWKTMYHREVNLYLVLRDTKVTSPLMDWWCCGSEAFLVSGLMDGTMRSTITQWTQTIVTTLLETDEDSVKHVRSLMFNEKMIRGLMDNTRTLDRHRILHGDLKPDNILVNLQSSEVRFTDFSLGHRYVPSATVRDRRGLGLGWGHHLAIPAEWERARILNRVQLVAGISEDLKFDFQDVVLRNDDLTLDQVKYIAKIFSTVVRDLQVSFRITEESLKLFSKHVIQPEHGIHVGIREYADMIIKQREETASVAAQPAVFQDEEKIPDLIARFQSVE